MYDFTEEEDVRRFIESEAMSMVQVHFQNFAEVTKFGFAIVTKRPADEGRPSGPAHSFMCAPFPCLIRGEEEKVAETLKETNADLGGMAAIYVSPGKIKTARGERDVVMIYAESKLIAGPIRYRAIVEEKDGVKTMSPFKDISAKKFKSDADGFKFLTVVAN